MKALTEQTPGSPRLPFDMQVTFTQKAVEVGHIK